MGGRIWPFRRSPPMRRCGNVQSARIMPFQGRNLQSGQYLPRTVSVETSRLPPPLAAYAPPTISCCDWGITAGDLRWRPCNRGQTKECAGPCTDGAPERSRERPYGIILGGCILFIMACTRSAPVSAAPPTFVGGPSEMAGNPYMNFNAARWAAGVGGLGATGRSILLTLAQMSDNHGVCFPTWHTLAVQSQCSKRTVGRYLAAFEERNLVVRRARFAVHHGRVGSFYILIGWPGRVLIPPTGHPKHGRGVFETPSTCLLHKDLQSEWHGGNVIAAMPKNSTLSIDSTTAAEIARSLERCLDALGPWANDENRRRLSSDVEGLSELLENFDLEQHVLPVLAAKSSHGTKAPPVRVWAYFREPIRHLALKLEREGSSRNSSRRVGAQHGQEHP